MTVYSIDAEFAKKSIKELYAFKAQLHAALDESKNDTSEIAVASRKFYSETLGLVVMKIAERIGAV